MDEAQDPSDRQEVMVCGLARVSPRLVVSHRSYHQHRQSPGQYDPEKHRVFSPPVESDQYTALLLY